jgi:peptidoglycan/LPS O-acetylase OafA/YrhL
MHYLGKIYYSIYRMHCPVLVFFEKLGFFSGANSQALDLLFAGKGTLMWVTMFICHH